LEYNIKSKYTDEKLYQLINERLDISKLEVLDINSRNIEIKKIKYQTKASNRQLSRVLGIGREILSRVK
jgi:hypothetical protein